jgi:hypothetical protein
VNHVISRPVALLIGLMIALAGTFVAVQAVSQTPAHASFTDCNHQHGSVGWVCLSNESLGSESELWISQNSHYCIEMGSWNDQATFISNQFATRVVRYYKDGGCNNAGQWLQLQPGTNYPLPANWWHVISSVYLYS